MNPVKKAFTELKIWLVINFISRAFLDTLLVFLFIMLLTIFLGIRWEYTLFIAIPFGIFQIIKGFNKQGYGFVEKRVPDLNEKLDTVADNIQKENYMIKLLKEDVLKNFKKIKTSYFINYKDLGLKSISLVILSFLIIALSASNVEFEGYKVILNDLNSIPFVKKIIPNEDLSNIILNSAAANESDIYGDFSMAELNNKELNLKINPINSEIDLSTEKEVENKDFSPPNFPKEIYTSYDISYNDKIPKKNQNIVKNYFIEITK